MICFCFGWYHINWVSKLQKIVALSAIETEYVVMIDVSKEMIWL